MDKIITLENWKGKSKIEIKETSGFNYLVREPRKVKETSEIEYIVHTIPMKNVEVLFDLLKEKLVQGEVYRYRYLVRMILNHYKFHEAEKMPFDTMMEAFNGGKFRAKYMFPYMYYPLKILENQGLIQYYGKGGICLK